jgi:hypothetical protein
MVGWITSAFCNITREGNVHLAKGSGRKEKKYNFFVPFKHEMMFFLLFISHSRSHYTHRLAFPYYTHTHREMYFSFNRGGFLMRVAWVSEWARAKWRKENFSFYSTFSFFSSHAPCSQMDIFSERWIGDGWMDEWLNKDRDEKM